MMTLRQFEAGLESLPAASAWRLTELAEYRGKQELFTRQSPQKLKVLREHALIESAVSSNRIEGVEVEASRVRTLVFGQAALRDREEEEVRGYRDALDRIHREGAGLDVSVPTILDLHRLSRGGAWDAGRLKEAPVDIIETYPDGRSRVRFRTVSPAETPGQLDALAALWNRGMRERWVPPLLLLGALNLDVLCIHPFRDGNGRVSRLLLLLALYHCGYEVGRYISLERIIEQNKDRYYETLERSSQGWHEGRHDPWPYLNYLLYILAQACAEFEDRVGQMTAPRGAKADMVLSAIRHRQGPFRLRDLELACPGVSREWIRRLLADLRQEGKLTVQGRGPGARWEYHQDE